ncbi:MAG TPA: DMT family transporter [Miltoncostaeaceae bacterium]|nr:DMT family transporter [Miltoncostaeaceae bacterium]
MIGAAALFSTGGAAIKGTDFSGVRGALEVAAWRSGIAAAVVALVMPSARRGWTWRTWAVGAAYAATVVLFVLANKQTTSANAIFLQSAAPLYVLLAGVFLLHERARLAEVGVMVVLLAGLALCVTGTGAAAETAPDPALGNIFALASGVTWAATLLGLRWLARGGQSNGAGAAVIAGNLVAFAACVPFALPPSGDGRDWALLIYLGVVQIALAYLMLTAAVRTVAAFEVSLLLLVEPALNPVWSWLFLGETPGAVTIAGGVLILGATAVGVGRGPARGPAGGGGGPAGAAPP